MTKLGGGTGEGEISEDQISRKLKKIVVYKKILHRKNCYPPKKQRLLLHLYQFKGLYETAGGLTPTLRSHCETDMKFN